MASGCLGMGERSCEEQEGPKVWNTNGCKETFGGWLYIHYFEYMHLLYVKYTILKWQNMSTIKLLQYVEHTSGKYSHFISLR